jgi:hypothetical protein
MTRNLSDIAADITAAWPKVYFGAVPYLRAMRTMDSIADNYGQDPGREIVLYFLSNATTFRGEKARELKAELKALLK